MPHRPSFVLVWALVLLAAAGAAAQAPPAPADSAPVITSVTLEQEGKVLTDPVLTALVETTAGRPFSIVDVRSSIEHLYGLNRYLDIQVTRETTNGGVALVYHLVPLRPIDRVEFEGILGLSEGRLREALRERFGSAPTASRIEPAIGLLREVYRDNGYQAVEIAWRTVPRTDADRSTLLISINAGARLVLKRVQFVEQDALPPGVTIGLPDVRDREGRPYSHDELRRTLDRWVERMRRAGYYEARAEPSIGFQPDGVLATVTLRRGPRVELRFTGTCLSRSEQERLVPVRSEATIDEDLLENSTIDIERYLRNRGYRDATAPHSRSEQDGRLVVTFDVKCGTRFIVGNIALSGNTVLPESTLRDSLLFEARDAFVESAIEASRLAIVSRYEDLGFNSVKVEVGFAEVAAEDPAAPRRIDVAFAITEGPRTIVRSLDITGNTALGDEEVQLLLGVTEGAPFSQRDAANGMVAVENRYRDLGFQSVAVTLPNLVLDADRSNVDLLFDVAEGTQTFIDRIIIDGNRSTSVRTIERELTLRPGDPLGASARLESEANLKDLGLFRRARIDERRHEADDRVDLIVRVEEARRTTLGYGGGLEISSRLRPTSGGVAEERIEFVPRGFFEIGRRNMWGKNRSVNLFTRISAKTRDTLVAPDVYESSYGVQEYRVFGTFREPKVLGAPAEVLVTGIAERVIRTSYSFVSREGRAEIGGSLGNVYSAAFRYSVKKSELFDTDNLTDEERPLIDRLFPRVRLSKLSGSLIRNTRRNELDPEQGSFLTIDAEIAARALGSEVGYAKTLVQLSRYWRLPIERRTVLAARAVLGAAHGFQREIPDDDGASVTPDAGASDNNLEDLPASERFFAGGSTTHRGFSVDRLGNSDTFTETGFPRGGNGELLLNGEVRMTLFSAIAGVAFLDVGNIYRRAGDISLGDLRPAAGGGLHYRSPVGPIRAEIGFNLDRRELSPGRLERGYVFHVSLGPAF